MGKLHVYTYAQVLSNLDACETNNPFKMYTDFIYTPNINA